MVLLFPRFFAVRGGLFRFLCTASLTGRLVAVVDSFVLPRGFYNSRQCLAMSSSDLSSAPRLLVSVTEHLGSGNKIRLILGSQSPRRREILDMMGLKGRFDAMPSPLDEGGLQLELLGKDSEHSANSNIRRAGMDPKDYTRILAEEKAKALASEIGADESDTIVLGSDTIVELDGKILEKPVDEADAKKMLRKLSGNRHAVHTGVALVCCRAGAVHLSASFTDTASVRFAELSDEDIDAYVATGEPMDKAGSYGIQGIGGQLVASIEGDFFTVS
jgi:septum formation protein